MSDALIAAFDDCLGALEAGASLDAVLARYPALADELRPMLVAAQAVRPSEPLRVPKQSEDASRARFLARARVLRSARRPAPSLFPQLSLALRLAVWLMALLTAGTLGGFGLVAAASPSLPGDLLYDVKRSAEQAQLALTADPAARAALANQFEARRLLEAQAVVAQGRVVAVAFTGVVEQQAGDRWVIAGLPVSVPAGQGAGVGLGRRVHVSGTAQADGVIRADRIEPADDGPTPPPSPTEPPAPPTTPAPTPTSEPSATADERETERAEPSRTPAPTQTPRPSVSPTKTGSGSAPSNTPPPATLPPSADPTHTAAPTANSGGGGPAPTATPPPPGPTATADPEPSETEHPEEVEFSGTVEATGAVWVISGQAVTITGETEFEDNPGLGDEVRVKAWRLPDGSLVAREIDKR